MPNDCISSYWYRQRSLEFWEVCKNHRFQKTWKIQHSNSWSKQQSKSSFHEFLVWYLPLAPGSTCWNIHFVVSNLPCSPEINDYQRKQPRRVCWLGRFEPVRNAFEKDHRWSAKNTAGGDLSARIPLFWSGNVQVHELGKTVELRRKRFALVKWWGVAKDRLAVEATDRHLSCGTRTSKSWNQRRDILTTLFIGRSLLD